MKRKKKHEEHVDESWLIPYADILTLLLALFIVLFAASEVDQKKAKEISNSFNSALNGGVGVMDNTSPIEHIEDTSQIPRLGDTGTKDGKSEIITPEQDQEELGKLQQNINDYIESKGLTARIETDLTKHGLLLTITEGVLFTPGSATVVGDAKKIATEISELLVTDPPRNIVIEGHTDNVPQRSTKYPTNWELSSARAINFMKILLENDKLAPEKFSAIGYGEYQPVDTNKTKKGRDKNRRVEVLILPYNQENE